MQVWNILVRVNQEINYNNNNTKTELKWVRTGNKVTIAV